MDIDVGRIKLVNQGNYSASTAYVVDDFVVYGDSTFVCVQAHAGSQVPKTGTVLNSSYWNYLAKGAATAAADPWKPGQASGAWLADSATSPTADSEILDRSVNGLNLTLTGSITQAGAGGSSDLAAFSGWSASNNLAKASPIPETAQLGKGNFTILCWVKLTSSPSGDNTVISFAAYNAGTASYTGPRYSAAISSSSTMQLKIHDGTTAHTITGGTAAVGSWNLLAVTRSGDTVKFIKPTDGVAQGTTTIASDYNLSNSVGKLFVGIAEGDARAAGQTSLALLRLYKFALSAEQVQKIYDNEKDKYIDSDTTFHVEQQSSADYNWDDNVKFSTGLGLVYGDSATQVHATHIASPYSIEYDSSGNISKITEEGFYSHNFVYDSISGQLNSYQTVVTRGNATQTYNYALTYDGLNRVTNLTRTKV